MGSKNNYKVYYNANGQRVMRVSNVIQTLSKKELIKWANKLGLQGLEYETELNRAANIGSLCHDVLEKYMDPTQLAWYDCDEFAVTEVEDIQQFHMAWRSFVRWYKKFTKERPMNIVFRERVIVGENLGGTIDCAIEGWKDPNKLIFVDYKTSSGFYLTQFLQLAAYVMIYEELYGPDTIEGVMVILLNKKGKKAKARFIPRKNLDQYILCFQCLMDVTLGVQVLNNTLLENSEVFMYA